MAVTYQNFITCYPQFKDDTTLVKFNTALALFKAQYSALVECLDEELRETLTYLYLAHSRTSEKRGISGGDIKSAWKEGDVRVTLQQSDSEKGQWLRLTPYGTEFWMIVRNLKGGMMVANHQSPPPCTRSRLW